MEIIPKKAPKLSKVTNVLLYLALVLLFFSIAGFFVLNRFIEDRRKDLADLEATLKEEAGPERSALEKEVLNYQKKIDDFSFLINQRSEGLKFFTAFQKVSHPKVWFSGLTLDSEEEMAMLLGQAQSFETLGQQLLILEDEDWIRSVDLKRVSINEEGEIDFDLSLSLDPQIF